MISKDELRELVFETYRSLDDYLEVDVEKSGNNSSYLPVPSAIWKDSYFIKVRLSSYSEEDCFSQSTFLEMWYLYKDKELVFDQVRVLERMRGKGLGSRMVEKSEELAKKLSCRKCKVDLDHNEKGFWQNRDYEDVGFLKREKYL